MSASVEDRLRRLEDERDIMETLYLYGHSLDYGLADEWLNCWTEDAVLQWPHRPPIVGHEALQQAYDAHTHAPDRFHKHVVVDPIIRIDGDRATVDSYFTRLDRYMEGPELRSFGRYRDKLVRGQDGHWRIQERLTERQSRRNAEPLPPGEGPL